MTSSASTTPCASPFAEVGRPPAANVTTSTVDIVRPAPFRTPTSPSSFTYVTPFSRECLEQVGSGNVAHLGDVRVPEQCVVVDRELRVERPHLAVRRHDEQVDLAEHRVRADEGVIELHDDRRDLLLLARIADARRVHEPPHATAALERVDVRLHEHIRVRRRTSSMSMPPAS